MSQKAQVVFVSSSRDMADWAAVTVAQVREFAVRHGLPSVEALDYRDIDPADLDHAATWQENVGAPSRPDVALTIVLFGERVGTPLPPNFERRHDIHNRLTRAGYDWVHVAGVTSHSLRPNEVPLTGVLFEFFDAFLPPEDDTPARPLRVIFKGKEDGQGEPDFGNGEFSLQIELLALSPQQKRQLRRDYDQQLEWMNVFWSRIYGLQQHASLFCADQATLQKKLERILTTVFTAGEKQATGGPEPSLDPQAVQLPGPASYDLEHAMFFSGEVRRSPNSFGGHGCKTRRGGWSR